MLFREIIIAYGENHTKPVNTQCGKMQSSWMKNLVAHIVTTEI